LTLHHWDFFGPDARKTAEHFQKHVGEFAATLSIRIDEEGFFSASPVHVCYWIAIEDEPMAELTQKKLRPKRSMSKPEHIRLIADVGQG
jgi:hypothetical protein